MEFDNFDWIYYIDKYKDLQQAGINTLDKAWAHWTTYGKKEGRICNNKIINTELLVNSNNLEQNICKNTNMLDYMNIDIIWNIKHITKVNIITDNTISNIQTTRLADKNIDIINKNTIFNWKFYINKYLDLQKAGINTQQKAYRHWILYGKKEGRICN